MNYSRNGKGKMANIFKEQYVQANPGEFKKWVQIKS